MCADWNGTGLTPQESEVRACGPLRLKVYALNSASESKELNYFTFNLKVVQLASVRILTFTADTLHIYSSLKK